MAKDTNKQLRNEVIYSIYVRNYSKEGTFQAVMNDLDRIQSLGVDIIWLMPIHPIGKLHRKGTLGSPYAIRDYREVNPEFGSKEDFQRLCEAIHKRGMKVIIDVVYNHTSPDSYLATHHPEWFFHKADGSLGNRVGDWWDVVDLDYAHHELWDYQIETLKMWAKDVDGFRCDVASMVPVDFWLAAREAVAKVRPGALWLAESVEPGFVAYNRSRGVASASDSEIYQAFDMAYDYDIFGIFKDYLAGKVSLQTYSAAINRQETIYPDNYVKARFLENHDRNRAHFSIPDEKALRNHLAFMYFNKGIAMLYNGQEAGAMHTSALFDKDPIDYDTGMDLSPLMRKLYQVKKNPIMTNSTYETKVLRDDVLMAIHHENASSPRDDQDHPYLVGLFHFNGQSSFLDLSTSGLHDGYYTNLIDGQRVEIREGTIATDGEPIILQSDEGIALFH